MKTHNRIVPIMLTAVLWTLLLASCSGPGSHAASDFAARINADTSAYHRDPIVVFNNSGKGVAVWTVNTGTAAGLLYAYYDGSSWSAEAEIEHGMIPVSYDLASNGTGFMLVYESNDNIYARAFDGSSWSGPILINVVYSTIECSDPKVASNGTGYAVVWHQLFSNTGSESIYSSIFNGGWSAPVRVDDGIWGPELPSITSNGAGYAAVWRTVGQEKVYASVYRSGSWSASVQLNASPGGTVRVFRIASNGTGYAVAWEQYDRVTKVYDVMANVYAGTDWQKDGSGNPVPTPLESGAGHAFNPDIASNGASYVVVWSQYEGETFNGDRSIFATIYSSGTWTVPAVLETGSGNAFTPRIASNGTGYAVAWSQADNLSYNIYSAFYSNGAWSSPDIIAGDEASQYQIIKNGGGFASIWLQPDSTGNSNITVKPHNGSNWGSGSMLVKNLHRGSSTGPIMATNETGVTLAVWTQYHNGIPRVYGSLNNGAGWGVPLQLSEGQISAITQDMATDGTGFMVVFSQGNDLHTRYCGSAGQMGSDTVIATYAYSPRIASNGTGYAITWQQYNQKDSVYDVYANIYDGSAWQASNALLETGALSAEVPRIASNGSGYAVAWYQRGNVYANIYTEASGWQTSGTVLQTGTDAREPDIASNGAGYAVTWREYKDSLWFDVYAIIFDGSDWQRDGSGNPAPVLLENAGGSADDPRIASNGEGYAVVWRQAVGNTFVGDLFANVYTSGTGWQTEASLTEAESQDLAQPTIASNGQGYAVAWLQHHDYGARTGISAVKLNGASWVTPAALETGDGNVSGPFIASNGTGYSAIWSQCDTADPLVMDIRARLGF